MVGMGFDAEPRVFDRAQDDLAGSLDRSLRKSDAAPGPHARAGDCIATIRS